MRISRPFLVAGAALLAGAGIAGTALAQPGSDCPAAAAAAATLAADPAAPRVLVMPVAALADDPFAQLARMSAEMDRQMAAMMQRVTQMREASARAPAGAPGVTLVGSLPAGGTYTFVSTTTTSGTDGKTCTRTVEYRSDGKAAEPQVTQAASGDCDAVRRGETVVPTATTAAPALPPRTV